MKTRIIKPNNRKKIIYDYKKGNSDINVQLINANNYIKVLENDNKILKDRLKELI